MTRHEHAESTTPPELLTAIDGDRSRRTGYSALCTLPALMHRVHT